MSDLLIQEHPLQVLPTLAEKIGLKEALILQQVHYWIQRSTNEKDGHRWVYKTYDKWQEEFPFWSKKTVRRTIRGLEEDGFLVSIQPEKEHGQTRKWYRIDHDQLEKIEDDHPQGQADHPTAPDGRSRNAHNAGTRTETTTETTNSRRGKADKTKRTNPSSINPDSTTDKSQAASERKRSDVEVAQSSDQSQSSWSDFDFEALAKRDDPHQAIQDLSTIDGDDPKNKFLTSLFDEIFGYKDHNKWRDYHGWLNKYGKSEGRDWVLQMIYEMKDMPEFKREGPKGYMMDLPRRALEYMQGAAAESLIEAEEDTDYTIEEVEQLVEAGYDREDFEHINQDTLRYFPE